jgi:hypothetical protein
LTSNYLNFFDGKCLDKKIVTNGSAILLGETKYYYVTEADGHATIHETKLPELPAGDDVLRSDIWGINPVSVDTTLDLEKCGRKMGVYWEKGKPIPDGTSNLPDGMIRLIGRYWHKDSIYTVKLTTNNYIPSTSLVIGVRKPKSLGTEANSANNIDDQPYNLDSLVIEYGGKEGIPPQLIKAMMKHETGFNPAYRYEPHKDAQKQSIRQDSISMRNSAYWIVDAGDVGQPQPPQNVRNLRDGRLTELIQYPGYVGTIWDYFDTHKFLYTTAYRSVFRERWGQRYLFNILQNVTQGKRRVTATDTATAKPIADDSLRNYLKTDYEGGFENRIAQTRIIASYGLLQLIYFFALSEDHYPQDEQTTPIEDRLNPPERLNGTDHYYLSFALHHLKGKFARYERSFNTVNWSRGFERTLRLTLNAYNGNSAREGVGRCAVGREVIDYGSQIMCWYNSLFKAQ